MAISKKTYKFVVGDLFALDSIYNIQGLADGDWWERTGEDLPECKREADMDMSEFLRCTRDVIITVIVETPNACRHSPASGPSARTRLLPPSATRVTSKMADNLPPGSDSPHDNAAVGEKPSLDASADEEMPTCALS